MLNILLEVEKLGITCTSEEVTKNTKEFVKMNNVDIVLIYNLGNILEDLISIIAR
jgi:hypothetical protein